MPSPVWSIVAATTMCAQEKEGSPLRAVCGGSRVARNDLLMGSPLLAEGDLREEGPHLSRDLREERSWIEQALPPLRAADKDGDHRMEVSIDPLGGWSQGSQLRPSGRRCDDEVLPPRAPAGPSPLPTEDGLRGERPARRSRWMPYRLPGFGAEPGRDGVPELDAVQVAEPAVVARPSVC